jgi:hypothetical protein
MDEEIEVKEEPKYILPAIYITKRLNRVKIRGGGSANRWEAIRALRELYNYVDRFPNNIIKASNLKTGINSKVKLLFLKALTRFTQVEIDEFISFTERAKNEFIMNRQNNSDWCDLLIIVDRLTDCVRRACIKNKINIISFNPQENRYEYHWWKELERFRW